MNLDNVLLASPDTNFSATFTAELQQVINISKFAEEILVQYPWMLIVIAERQTTQASLDSIDVLQVTQTHLGYAELATLSEIQQLSLLRVSRHLGMLMFLWRDVLNQQSIETSLDLVSRLADTLIMQAYDFAYAGFEQRYGTPTDEHGRQELYILGMGKLGGKELNFSSDIDLIFTYPQVGEFSERSKPFEYQQFFIKVAQKLIHLLNTQTTDGQVYRVDMRLRPFGESGPLVLPFSAMENYYESQGRSWERFAMLKSRIINPVPAAQDPNKLALANIIRPFIYRRYVDFSIIESLRDLKQKIVQEVRRRQLHHNIKLGAGGIREVEFLVQSFQLIYAGRIPALKTASIFSALAVIEQEALLPHDVVQSITHCYLILRKAEHTLQQFNNAQTQTLPDTQSGQDTLGAIMYGYFADRPELNTYCPTKKGIMHGIEQVQGVIHQHFSVFIQDETPDSMQQDQHDWSHDIWQEISHDPSHLPNIELVSQQLRQSASPIASELVEPVLQQLQQLATALNKAQIGDRGEAILIKLVPVFLTEISQQPQGHLPAVQSISALLIAIASRTAYLELIMENLGVRQQLLLFCTKSSWVIEHICAYPVLLDELIHPQYLQHSEHDIQAWREDFNSELQQILLRIELDDDEVIMHSMRQFKLAQRFRIAAADILDYLPIAQVSDKLTVLAEVLLDAQIKQAWHQTARRLGEPQGYSVDNMGIGVIAYGKLGGFELSYTSDLDIVFVHDCPSDVMTQGGKQSVSAQHFYIKLIQRVVNLAGTNSLLGDLYEIDLRLRPSGNSGLVICHIDTFAEYQKDEAWVWEHQALCRTRMILGNQTLTTKFNQIRQAIIGQTRDSAQLINDVGKMRQKMRDHLGEKDKGSLADIEFLTQYWCLLFTATHPDIIHYSDNLRQLAALGDAQLIPTEDAELLINAYLSLRHHQHHEALHRAKLDQAPYYAKLEEQVQRIWDRTFVDV